MPNFRVTSTLAAGGQVANMLAGSPFEFVPRDSKVAIGLASDGFDVLLQATVTFGSELEIQNAVIAQETGGGVGPRIPDNIIVDDVAEAGDRLVIELNNAGLAVRVVTAIVRILPI